MLLEGETSMVRWHPNGLDLDFMIWWDLPNLLTLSSSAYKRRGALMEKVSLDELGLDWLVIEFCSLAWD